MTGPGVVVCGGPHGKSNVRNVCRRCNNTVHVVGTCADTRTCVWVDKRGYVCKRLSGGSVG